ncbi:MAG: intermembrane transport protein PqiB [Methylococcaceae bacterium]|jgi:paraquat-inducible protein B
MPELPPLNELPEALALPPRNRSVQWVWIIPLLAVCLGAWVGINALLQSGPTVTIRFLTAEGLEAGKTKIRYKDVDIGEVTAIAISKDRSNITVTAAFKKESEDFLVKDTRFWVVRPRFSGGQMSGFGTLLSGAYIAIDIGKSNVSEREFTGLEVAPILTDNLPGRQFMLEAQDMGSLDIGSPIYFRHIHVGEVIAHELDPNGKDVHIHVFIHAPYDQYVYTSTRFWNASGFDVTLDSNGLRLETQSVSAILSGGVAFETPPTQTEADRADAGSTFSLHKDRVTALKSMNSEPEIFVMQFGESLRGLTPGAPVEFRGLPIGEVQSVDVTYDKTRKIFEFPVHVAIFREHLEMHDHDGNPVPMDSSKRFELLDTLIAQGFRAQLRPGSLLTGQLYIALDFFPDAPAVTTNWEKRPLQLPTVPGTVEELQQSAAKIMRKIDKIPLETIGNKTGEALSSLNSAALSLNQLIKRLDAEVAPESTAAIAEIRKTLLSIQNSLAVDSPLQQDLRQTLKETTRTAQSIRSLADTLDQEPESLLRGKTGDTP